ncbi:MAG: ABC transporter ATP-binding protein [Candidatus Electrothrix gigas]
MSSAVIKIENLWKEYRLGVIGHGTLTHDLQSWWAKMRGKEDPNAKITPMLAGQEKQIEGDRFWALRDINLEVKEGEILGIIGKNGAGKSTLLKILSRVTAPTKGNIKVKGRIASLLEVGTGFHPELTGRENIFMNGAILGMSKQEIRDKLDEIIDFSGVEDFIDTPVKRYSSGMYVRLAFAVAAHLEPEILVVDEVLAVGDAEFQKKCLGKMNDVAQAGKTVLFVSHSMSAMDKLCSQAVLLKNGRVHHQGETDTVISMYLEQSILAVSKKRESKKKIYFTKTWISDAYGSLITSIEENMEWCINIQCKINGKVSENLSISIALRTAEGNLLAGMSNYITGDKFKYKQGENIFVCHIKRLSLNSGTYFYKLEAIADSVLLDRVECAGNILVARKKVFRYANEVPSRFPIIADHSWSQV